MTDAISPGVLETCTDGIDQACDGADNAGSFAYAPTKATYCRDVDGYGDADHPGLLFCDLGAGYSASDDDCDDADAATSPAETDPCDDGVDNDRSGGVDDCGRRRLDDAAVVFSSTVGGFGTAAAAGNFDRDGASELVVTAPSLTAGFFRDSSAAAHALRRGYNRRMAAVPLLRPASLDDLLKSIHDGVACEIIAGELVEKAAGDIRHGAAQAELTTRVHGGYNRRPRSGGPLGGWWIRTEVDIWFADDVYRPDLSGWRRDRVPVLPDEWPVPIAPDWVAEVLSASTAKRDLTVKMRGYHAAGVSHYWVVDRQHELFIVYQRTERSYEILLTGTIGETVRAAPFEGIEIDVGRLFGVESDDEPGDAPG